jgi:hypothetical protein
VQRLHSGPISYPLHLLACAVVSCVVQNAHVKVYTMETALKHGVKGNWSSIV